jgi:hypothetical protein
MTLFSADAQNGNTSAPAFLIEVAEGEKHQPPGAWTEAERAFVQSQMEQYDREHEQSRVGLPFREIQNRTGRRLQYWMQQWHRVDWERQQRGFPPIKPGRRIEIDQDGDFVCIEAPDPVFPRSRHEPKWRPAGNTANNGNTDNNTDNNTADTGNTAANKIEEHAREVGEPISLDTIGFRTRADDKIAPPPTWLVAGLIEADSDCALYAPMQFLKSFAAIDIAYAVATGVNALGTLPVIEPGPVIYYAAEGYADVVKRRSVAWEIAHRRDAYSVDNILFGKSAPYVSEPTLIAQHVNVFQQWLGARRAKLIVIDTLNRALGGQDEDRAHTASLYLNTAKVLREKLGGATLTIAHKSNKGDGDRGLRGSSAFEAGFDTVLEIREHRKDELTGTHTIALTVKKLKSGEDGQTFYLQSQFVKTPDGESLVLIGVSELVGRAALDAKQDDRKITADLIEDVLFGITDGGHVGTSRLIEALTARTRRSKSGIEKALERGLDTGEFARFKAGRGRWVLPEISAIDQSQKTADTVFH